MIWPVRGKGMKALSHRGCYMAARRYKISLCVLKIFHEWAQQTSEIFFQQEKRDFVSPSSHVMFFSLYKHQWTTKQFHFNNIFSVKGAIYFSVKATVIFSRVKITCYFRMWKYQIFAGKLTWYFIGVYIIKILMKCNGSVRMFFFYGKQDNRVQKVSSLDILSVLTGLCNIVPPPPLLPMFVDE